MMAQKIVQGVYQFHQQELVASFKFSPDNKFDFFYSNGAVDRTATGTFSITGDTLHIKSDKEPGKDFTIKSESQSGAGYHIQFEGADKYLLSNIRCSFFTSKERRDEYTDENGIIEINLPHCDSIYAFHELFPDMASVIKDEKNDNNHSVVTLNPTLGQVSFKGIAYKVDGNKLIAVMPNNIFPIEDVIFINNKNNK